MKKNVTAEEAVHLLFAMVQDLTERTTRELPWAEAHMPRVLIWCGAAQTAAHHGPEIAATVLKAIAAEIEDNDALEGVPSVKDIQ